MPRRTAALALAALLLAAGSAPAQRPRGEPAKREVLIPPGGTELFRALLDRSGIRPVTARELDNLGRTDDVIVIALGPPNDQADVPDPGLVATAVVARGGTALVATDAPTAHLRMTREGGVVVAEVGEGRVWCGDDNAVLRRFTPENPLGEVRRDCPFVVPLTRAAHLNAPDPNSPIGKVFDGLTRVAANSPSYLRLAPRDGFFRYALAGFPRNDKQRDLDSYLADDDGDNRRRLPDDALFAFGWYVPEGARVPPQRYLGVADHSVFINQMFVEPGVQNLELTYRVIDFLSDPTVAVRNGKRTRVNRWSRCVFIENGRVVERFDELRSAFVPPRPPIPPINPEALQKGLVEFGNRLMAHAETNDLLNRGLLGLVRFPTLLRFLVILLAVYATWFLLRRMVSARKPTDVPPPPAVAGVPAGPPGVFDRRQKELLRRNNLYEPVRDLLREFFASVGVHGEPGPRPPGVVVSDAVRRADSLRQAVRDFWKLAYGRPQEVTVSRWREMEPYFDRLRQAFADGKWHFVFEAEAATT